jgi:hypothetical protein
LIRSVVTAVAATAAAKPPCRLPPYTSTGRNGIGDDRTRGSEVPHLARSANRRCSEWPPQGIGGGVGGAASAGFQTDSSAETQTAVYPPTTEQGRVETCTAHVTLPLDQGWARAGLRRARPRRDARAKIIIFEFVALKCVQF